MTCREFIIVWSDAQNPQLLLSYLYKLNSLMVDDWLQLWVETSAFRGYEIKGITYHHLHIFSLLELSSWPLQCSPGLELQLCDCVSRNHM